MTMKIQVCNNQIGDKKVKQIELWIGDLIFYSYVRSERDIKLAERLAKENDTELDRKDL